MSRILPIPFFVALVMMPTVSRSDDRDLVEPASNKDLLSQEFTAYVRTGIDAVIETARKSKAKGDARTEELVRAAARAMENVPERWRGRAFILTLAVSFDTGPEFRKSAITARFWTRYETDAQCAERNKIVNPTSMLGRADLNRHYFAAAGILAVTSPGMSEAICILKEVSDANGGSGFSFKDLAADLAGMCWAERILTEKRIASPFGIEFAISNVMPDISDLAEGVTLPELREQFLVDSKDRFKAEVAAIRQRVLALPHYRQPAVASPPLQSSTLARP